MSRAVYLHVGAPKTGTTYLQDRLSRNVASLAKHDVHFPTGSPLVSPALFHFRAALDLLGQDWGGAPGHADGSWDAMVRRVRRRSGTVVISHEILAPANADKVAKAKRDLTRGGDVDLHVVYSVRDLARQLPAAWQESIKQGRKWSYRRFLRRMRRGRSWFARAFDVPDVLGTWGAGLPPENIHVITVPPKGAPRDPRGNLLWLRFCEAVGIDPAWAPQDSDQLNRSLGVAETQVIRKLNRQMERTVRREASFDALIRGMLAQEELVRRSSPPVRLPPQLYPWAEQETARWVDWLTGSGVHVVGDLADLTPLPPAEDEPWHDPDKVPAKQQLKAAVDALGAMTHEAARRPDPERTLAHKVRQGADLLRGR